MAKVEVSSILARRLLEALNFNPRFDFDPERPDLYAGTPEGRRSAEEPEGYRLWLRDRLHSSGLAEALPGCQDLLPDIYEDFPWLRSFAWLVKPRNYRELAQHICRYLDWYVDRNKPVRYERLWLDLLQGRHFRSLAGAFVSLFYVLLFAGGVQSSELLAGIGAGLLLFFIFALAYVHSYGGGGNYMANKDELFLYLREQYADAVEPPSAHQEGSEQELLDSSASLAPSADLEAGMREYRETVLSPSETASRAQQHR